MGLVIAAVVAGCGGSGSSGTHASTKTFDAAEAPFTFQYPATFKLQPHLVGGASRNRPTYQTAVGPGGSSYVLVATYPLLLRIRADGSAMTNKGKVVPRATLAREMDAAIQQIGSAAGMRLQGTPAAAALGALPARVYSYAKADGSLGTTFIVALIGRQEIFVACQHTPSDRDAVSSACDTLRRTFALR